MEIRRPKVEALKADTDTEALLNARLIEAAKAYHEAEKIPLFKRIETYDEAVLQFVFLCDARAQLENDEIIGTDHEFKWVAVARSVLKVASKNDKSIADHLRTRLFSEHDSDIELQCELYHDMAERIFVSDVNGPKMTGFGPDYSADVATGAIYLR